MDGKHVVLAAQQEHQIVDGENPGRLVVCRRVGVNPASVKKNRGAGGMRRFVDVLQDVEAIRDTQQPAPEDDEGDKPQQLFP